MQDRETAQDIHETPCPRCGAEASWRKLDLDGSRIELRCTGCGVHTLTREEFELAATENTPVDEERG